MNVNPAQVAAVLKTLPVGYYLGIRAPVVLDENAAVSYVNVMTREIHVSFQNVARALAGVPDGGIADGELEGTIRSLLYHEVGHLLLTPAKGLRARAETNILEDERLETLLRGRFHGVDFRKLRDRMSPECLSPDYDPAKDDKFELALFGVVRFRKGPAKFSAKLDEIISKNASVNCGPPEYGRSPDVYDMSNDYAAFVDEVRGWWESEREKRKDEEKNGPEAPKDGSAKDSPKGEDGSEPQPEGDGKPEDEKKEPEKGEEPEGGKSGSEPEEKDGEEPEKDEGEPEEGEGEPEDEGESPEDGGEEAGEPEEDGEGPKDEDGEPEEGEEPVDGKPENGEGAPPMSGADFDRAREGFKRVFEATTDADLARAIDRLVVAATRKRSRHVGVSRGYAGKVDPRAVGIREDFRWLVKPGDSGAGKFERIHLRLWIDRSGSMDDNMGKVNTLVSTVLDAEKRMPGVLAVTVISSGWDTKVHDKAVPLVANGGNDFGPGVVETERATRKSGWRNVNVCVWDGLMFNSWDDSESVCRAWARDHADAYRAIDGRDTVIVSDASNRPCFETGCPNARKQYIRGNYVERFTDAVVSLLGAVL